jgi:NAD(P)-dependent dehydrogenase (short-subunit alcohol dehydrogenase family)
MHVGGAAQHAHRQSGRGRWLHSQRVDWWEMRTAACKHAIIGISKAAAREEASIGIRENAIAP